MRNATDASHEGVDLLLGIVEGKRGANGARDAQTIHQRLSTVMTCAHSDAQTVEQRSHIQVVDITDVETHDRIFLRCILRAVDLHAFDGLELLHAVAGELMLMLLDSLEADGLDIVDGLRESVSSHIVGRASLKLEGQALEGGLLL